ncbi:hypothetical protein [Nocardia wallacei]|uniref:Uncharacterized protein n=1 Tax=Nocardia wallacei TaxID=480035 RepID=A0A7G1KTC5_9NOCA|nr:hypothetical protein [Nocardia wallacei]BCK58430.1 hypothetical protein NWFMUON74_62020 [Nocardia wallacei]
MSKFVLRFDVPDEHVALFAGNLETYLDQMSPLTKWLERQGGSTELIVNDGGEEQPRLW